MDRNETTTRTARTRRIPVPGQVFALQRPPAFALYDEYGQPAMLGRQQTMWVAPADLEALRDYLYRNLAVIARPGVASEARTWALHRALLYEGAGALVGQEERSPTARLVSVARTAARCALQDPTLHLAPIAGQPDSPATHAAGTALYAGALAAAAGMHDADRLTAVTLAGVFADAGKRTMSQSALQWQGPLDEREWGLMRQHPHRSIELMRRAGIIAATAVHAVRWHHERWAGGGYPDGLYGDEIPFEARVMAIADAFSALSMDRPFRDGSGPYDALVEMSKPVGQFDPALLRTFVQLLGGTVDETAQPPRRSNQRAHAVGAA